MKKQPHHGDLHKDESEIWHYNSLREKAIELAASEAVRIKGRRAMVFWHEGIAVPVKSTDTAHSLIVRHNTWKQALLSGELAFVLELVVNHAGVDKHNLWLALRHLQTKIKTPQQ